MAQAHTNGRARSTRVRVGDARPPQAKAHSGKPLQTDSLENLLSGMGGARDKTIFTRFANILINQQQLDAAYRGDWISRKIIDIPAYDSTREWRQWQADKDEITVIEEQEKDLKLKRRLMSGLIKARLYGGAALVMGIAQGKPEEEVNLDALKEGDLQFIHAVSRYEITAGELDLDISSPTYGEPQWYESMGIKPIRLHPSRVVRLIGAEPPREVTQTINGWGDPILQIVMDAILQTGTVLQGIAQLVQEAQVDVIKVPGLTDQISDPVYEARLKKRFGLAADSKSIYNMLLLDKEEDWERVTANFASMSDIAKLYLEVVSGAADIPATRMLGQSPRGLNATGVSDIRNYYDSIASKQESDLSPAIEKLDEVLIRSALGTRPDEIFYEWNPLWQMDEAQSADIANKKATTFKLDVDAAVLDPAVLKKARENQLIEDGTYPGLEAAIAEQEALVAEGLAEPYDPTAAQVPPPAPGEVGASGATGATDPGATGATGATGPKKKTPVKDALDDMADRLREATRNIGTKDAAPRTLYVRRNVVNADEIIAWYKKQGLPTLVPADQMHVTLAYSTSPVDWSKAGDAYGIDDKGQLKLPPGGMRLTEKFGDALVLLISSSSLSYRHADLKSATGATWKWPDYQPHITLTYKTEGIDLSLVKPYIGPIVLGPEIFEEVNSDYREELVEDAKWEGS